MDRSRLISLASRWLSGLTLAGTLLAGPASPARAADWNPGMGAVGDGEAYAGTVDFPSAGSTVPGNAELTITGWVVDRTAQGWAGIDEVQVYAGIAGAGGTLLGKALHAQSRPDVGNALSNPYYSASGFVLTVPAGKLPQGPTVLTIYAHTPSKGWWYRPVSFTIGAPKFAFQPEVYIETPTKGEKILTSKSSYEIRGYAYDRNAGRGQGTGVNRVELYLGAPKDDPTTLYLGEATLKLETALGAQAGDQFSTSGWSFTISPTAYHTNNYNLYVYARSSLTNKEGDAIVNFDIQDK